MGNELKTALAFDDKTLDEMTSATAAVHKARHDHVKNDLKTTSGRLRDPTKEEIESMITYVKKLEQHDQEALKKIARDLAGERNLTHLVRHRNYCLRRFVLHDQIKHCGNFGVTGITSRDQCLRTYNAGYHKCMKTADQLREAFKKIDAEIEKMSPAELAKVATGSYKSLIIKDTADREFDTFTVGCSDGKCTITKCKNANCRTIVVDRDDFDGCDPEGSGVCIDSGHCDYDSGVCFVDTSFYS